MGRRFKGYFLRQDVDSDSKKNIKDAQTTLEQYATELPDKVANAYCYLAYRCLDGQYKDVDGLSSKIDCVLKVIDGMPDTHIRARWLVAVCTAHTYLMGTLRGVDAINVEVLDRALDIHLLLPPSGWQRSIANSLSCHYIRALIAKKSGDLDKVHEMIYSGIEVYKRVLPTFEYIDDSSSIVFEVLDTARIFGCLVMVGKGTDFPVRYLWHVHFTSAMLAGGPLRDLVSKFEE